MIQLERLSESLVSRPSCEVNKGHVVLPLYLCVHLFMHMCLYRLFFVLIHEYMEVIFDLLFIVVIGPNDIIARCGTKTFLLYGR